MRNASLTIWVMAVFVVVICFSLPKADATIYFDDGGTHTIDYAIHDTVYVDYGTPDAGTQVELVDTGSIDGYLKSYENSRVTVSGGRIDKSLWTYGNSRATVSGGEMYGLKSYENSQVTVSGGEIGYSLWANDNSEVTVSGGNILYWLGALENSRVTVSGGMIGYGVYAGCPPGWDTGILTFEGTDFAVNGNPVGYGDFASDYAVAGTEPGGISCLTGTLTGTLADGGTLNKTFYIFDDADITFAIHEPAIIYVDADATGANDGSSWADTYNDLQDALSVAWSGDEIRVAQGIYKPDQGDGITPGDRTATFQLINGVAIRGGYAGFGEPDPNARDIEAYKTILSGDLNGDDGPDFANNGENSYHVVTGSWVDSTAVLDGLTITGGNANERRSGGGMYNNYSSPTLINCTFRGNSGSEYGGAMLNISSHPTLTNCVFSRNSANYGGGIYNRYSDPTLTNCTFSSNWSVFGAGMRNYYSSKPTLTNCTFSKNAAWCGGGMENYHSSPIMTNCTFSGNSADWGGGMSNTAYGSPILTNCAFSRNSAKLGGGVFNDSSLTLTNCAFSGNSTVWMGGGMANIFGGNLAMTNSIFSGNSAGQEGGAIYNEGSNSMLTNCTFSSNSAHGFGGGAIFNMFESSATIINCILWNDMPNEIGGDMSVISHTDIQGGWPGEGNIDADPCFLYASGGDLRLLPDSACIDAGDNTAVPPDSADLDGDGDTVEPTPWDLDGRPRFIDDPCTADTGNGTAPIVDMGAYEPNYMEVQMKFTPQALNLKSKGKWLKAHFVLPAGFLPEDVNTNTPAVIAPLGIESDHMNIFINEDDLVEIEAAFSRSDFCGSAKNNDDTEVIVIGLLNDGQNFYGTDTIRIITKNLRYLGVLASHWLEGGCGAPDWCGGVDLDHSSMVDFVDFAMFDGCCIEVIKQ